MKRFKKLISVVLAVATVVSLTACGSGSSSSGGSATRDPKADVNVFFRGCGAVYNNPELTKTAERAVENIVGKENNLYVERSGINEDFSHIERLHRVYLLLSAAKETV